MPTAEVLEEAMQKLTGEITQVPSAYSAIKIHGQKACDLARKNIAVTIPARKVWIYRLALLAKRDKTLLLDVDCSKGTYIRTLCTDLGESVGIPATMSFLVRTRVGDFSLSDAYTLEELKEVGEDALLLPEDCLSHLPVYELPEHRQQAFCNGLPTHDTRFSFEELHLRVYSQGNFLGIGRYDRKEETVTPEKVFLN